jgi:pimeloyl-ACP methyl ester carboxylesterase
MRIIAVLALAFIIAAGPAQALDPPSAVVTDPAIDAAHPPVNKQLLVPSGGLGMNALFLLASGEGAKPTVVLLHGLPGNEQNLDLAQAIRRAGWNVLTLHYRGSWGSPGEFSIASAVEDAQAAVQYIRQPAVAAKYKVDTDRVVIAGHSMGGFAAARYAATHPDVAGLILIDPWNVGVDAKVLRSNPLMRAEYLASFDDLGNSLAGADAESLADEVEKSSGDWDLVAAAPRLAQVPMLSIWADRGISKDNTALADAIDQQGKGRLTTRHFPADHAFTEFRIALASEIVAWLQALPKQPSGEPAQAR